VTVAPLDTADDLVLRVAWLYHFEGLTQSEIAQGLELPRSRVIKLLRDALNSGTVSVQLSDPRYNGLKIELELKRRLGLKDAFVIPTPKQPQALVRLLGRAAAAYLPKIVRNGMTIGTAWGAALLETAKQFRPLSRRDMTVAMLMGGTPDSIPEVNPSDVARLFAERLNGRMYYLCAPLVLEDPALRVLLLKDKSIRTPLVLARASNIALLGAGGTHPDATLTSTGVISGAQLAELRAKGAVGDLLGRFYDLGGAPIRTELDDRVVGLELADLRQIALTVLVAGGPHKVMPITGAIRGRYINTLVTDEATAQALLELNTVQCPRKEAAMT